MKQRLRLFKKAKHGIFFVEDTETRKQSSLRTRDRTEARRLFAARVEALHQPAAVNIQLARTLLLAGDPTMAGRTWKQVLEQLIETKSGKTQHRWKTAAKDKALMLLLNKPLVETRAEHFLEVLHKGTVSTNKHLRQLHNFALDMSWLLAPVLPKKRFPKQVFREKRAITEDEHRRIIAREKNPERRAYYEVLWWTGGAQTDIVNLCAEDIQWDAIDELGRQASQIVFFRRKLQGKAVAPCQLTLEPELVPVLKSLPQSGPLFPYLRTVREADRATEFKQRCQGLGIHGITLHSYRYSVAERMLAAGMPERFAQQVLGHNSKAMSRYYSRRALVRVPSVHELKMRRGREQPLVQIKFARPAEAVRPDKEALP
jgi:integrase